MRRFIILLTIILLVSSSPPSISASDEPSGSSIYEVLKTHGLPMGLLPKGVKNFSYDNSGKFEVHLDRACNAKFENELHYDTNVSGTIRYGQIDELSGITAQDLFLWFPVIEIRVDIPSSGLIYFDVGVVSKQFSLSSFETPRDCLVVPGSDLQAGRQIVDAVSKIRLRKFGYELDQNIAARKALSEGSCSIVHIYLFVVVCVLTVVFVVHMLYPLHDTIRDQVKLGAH